MRWLAGTRKGCFSLERRRDGWRVGEPRYLGVPVTALARASDGAIWIALRHRWWGPKLARSEDGGATFEERPCPAFPEGAVVDAATPFGRVREAPSARAVTSLAADGGALLAGADPGALFRSDDGGATWALDDALWARRNADGWFPSGGGLMLHSVAPPFVAVSAGGVYRRDGGTWTACNAGLPAPGAPGGALPDVHRLRRCGGDVLWQQNYDGVWRSGDGGATWRDVSAGLPARGGFALAADGDAAWVVPHAARAAPAGRLAVWRTDDAGASWRAFDDGLPRPPCYATVLRDALEVDGGAVALGTTTGSVFVAPDGAAFEEAAAHLPPVLALLPAT